MACKEWLNGDKNPHFFKHSIKSRKSKSIITKIKDSSRVQLEESDLLQNMLITNFSARFKSIEVHPTNTGLDILRLVTAEDNDMLILPIQDDEIKNAIFQLDKLKTPTPDGFRATFFQDDWYIIHKDVCEAIKSFSNDKKC